MPTYPLYLSTYLSVYLPIYLSLFLTTISTICTHPFIYTLTYSLLVSPNYPGILPVLLHAVLLSTSTDNSTCIIAALEVSSSIIIIQLFIDCYPCRLLSVPKNKLVQHLLSSSNTYCLCGFRQKLFNFSEPLHLKLA